MADKKISDLERLSRISGNEEIPVAVNGANYKVTPTQITAEVASAQANDSKKITELQGKLNGINNVKEALDAKADATELEKEKSRATAAEKQNADAIAEEVTRAKGAEQSNANAIAAEQSRAEKAEQANAADIDNIESLIPTQASANNKLADKEFVNSSIATNTAEFKGTFTSLEQLKQTTADANDYGFVVATDIDGNTVYNRYKYVEGTGWVFEYALNNSSFTASQWAAINSNITAELTNKLANEVATKDELDVVETLAESVNKGLGETIQRVETLETGLQADKENLKNFKESVERDYVREEAYNKDKETIVGQITQVKTDAANTYQTKTAAAQDLAAAKTYADNLKFKTINGQSIKGDGNIEIESNTDNLEIGTRNLLLNSKTVIIKAGGNYSGHIFTITLPISTNDVFTLRVDEITNIAGNPEEYTAVIYNKGLVTNYCSPIRIRAGKEYQLKIYKQCENLEAVLAIYAGIGGEAAGNSVQLDRAMLVKGNKMPTTWSPAPEDIQADIQADIQDVKDIATDGVYAMYHRLLDNYQLSVAPEKWPALEAAGETADGVLVVEGGRYLVVALDEAQCNWSSVPVDTGNKDITNRLEALDDFSGRSNTTEILKFSEANGENYAAGFCNKYQRLNTNGSGIKQGSWWLPSLGELMMIYAHKQKINYALSLISGAKLLQETSYWASTEFAENSAWLLFLSGGLSYGNSKATNKCNTRPVSTFYRTGDEVIPPSAKEIANTALAATVALDGRVEALEDVAETNKVKLTLSPNYNIDAGSVIVGCIAQVPQGFDVGKGLYAFLMRRRRKRIKYFGTKGENGKTVQQPVWRHPYWKTGFQEHYNTLYTEHLMTKSTNSDKYIATFPAMHLVLRNFYNEVTGYLNQTYKIAGKKTFKPVSGFGFAVYRLNADGTYQRVSDVVPIRVCCGCELGTEDNFKVTSVWVD